MLRAFFYSQRARGLDGSTVTNQDRRGAIRQNAGQCPSEAGRSSAGARQCNDRSHKVPNLPNSLEA
jgi:hypothetical protein